MIYLTILGSGSSGNAALVETPKTRLLIDGGLSARQLVERLRMCGVNPLEIDGILLTHEHCDHSGGLDVWCKQFSTPVYCNRLTAESLRRDGKVAKDWRLFLTGSDFQIGDLVIESFPVPHDAVEPGRLRRASRPFGARISDGPGFRNEARSMNGCARRRPW
jgi:phosphoribosyl 1,2-cyclic phosphodiesterase